MDINFDAINHKMDDIRTEFAQFIDDDKYTEAENVINAIMMVLDANADIRDKFIY